MSPTLLFCVCVLSTNASAHPPRGSLPLGYRVEETVSKLFTFSHGLEPKPFVFFAWRLLSSHRRPGLAFFHCGMGMGPTFIFPATEVLVGRTARELLSLPALKSSQHLSDCSYGHLCL